MARHAIARQKLRCRDGHWEWADWQVMLYPLPTGNAYLVMTPCDLGNHYLYEVGDGRVGVRTGESHLWLTREDAEAARDCWEQQEAGVHPEETTL